jgi:transcriptional regulator with XRE-family HTH domain
MTRAKRAEPKLPPGPAREIVDLFRLLRGSSSLRVGQIANRAGYTPGHVSEVLRGWKTPSPEAAARIVQALGGSESAIRRARRHAEELEERKRDSRRVTPPGPAPVTAAGPIAHALAEALRAAGVPAAADGRDSGPADFPLDYQLSRPDVRLRVMTGDLLDQDTHLAVGFSDTFDTSTADDRIIHSSSLQGQLLQRVFAGDQAELDERLAAALAGISPERTETRHDKPYGKLARYPLGTVAVLGEPRRLVFAVAYGSMGNDLVVRAPVAELWSCYTLLWEAVYRHGQLGALSIPIMGSGLARIDTLDHENILRLILLSFVAYSRLRRVCRELRVVIQPADASRIDPVGLRTFLRTL